MKSQKYNFLYALIITILIFNFGIFMGYKLETSRLDKINDFSLLAEIELLDQKVQSDALSMMDLNCDLLVQENIIFADKIFEDAKKIQNYENANRMNNEITILHKKYDLLRALFWMNSLKVQKKCNSDYHNVVYFYDYDAPTLDQKSRQRFFSNLLGELKSEEKGKVMLIPMAGDLDAGSINLLMDKYGVESLPAILIDEKVVLTDVESLEQIRSYLN